MGILKKIFRKRTKEKDPVTGVKKVTVTDHRGTVRKTKVKDKKNQITTKERYNRAGDLIKRKAKGKYIKRFKAKTSDPNFDQSVFARNQQMAGKVSTNPILNAKRNEIINKGTDTQKIIQKDQIKADDTQKKTTTTPPSVTKKETEVKVPTTKKETSFSDAFKEARKKNIEKGIAHIGDSEGYFDWKGKQYNTELKEEKAARLKPKTEVIVNKTSTSANTTPNVNTVDKSLQSKSYNTSSYDDIDGRVDGYIPPATPKPKPTPKKNDNKSNVKTGQRNFFPKYRHGGSTGRGPNGIL
jgi:hypothetical protein